MSQPKVNISQAISNPTLSDLLDLVKKDIFLNLNCHAIATVTAFNSTRQTVQATVNYTKTYSVRAANGVYVNQEFSYPPLIDCPVLILGGGSAALTFPIVAGDQCLVLFNDRDMDNWVAGARSGPVASARLHSFSDGLVLVGLNKITSYDTTRAVLKNGTALVGVGPALVKIANEVTTLKTVLLDLIDAINGMSVVGTTGNPGDPIMASVSGIPGSINTEVESLLE